MKTMDKIDNFKAELRDLLKKYGASITCNVEGDTQGLNYEMVVDFGSEENWREHKLSDGNGIDWNIV